MTGRDWSFKGCDFDKGATFEHACGSVIRIGPSAPISSIADVITRHNCEEERKYDEPFDEQRQERRD
jgi:hypothetical protein